MGGFFVLTSDAVGYIEMFYNRTRRHIHVGNISPEVFEQNAMSIRPHGSAALFRLFSFDRRAGEGMLLVGVVAKTLAIMIQCDPKSPNLRFNVVSLRCRAPHG